MAYRIDATEVVEYRGRRVMVIWAVPPCVVQTTEAQRVEGSPWALLCADFWPAGRN